MTGTDRTPNLGMAFQTVDDLLDLTGSESETGKTVGRDADLGKLTRSVRRAVLGKIGVCVSYMARHYFFFSCFSASLTCRRSHR